MREPLALLAGVIVAGLLLTSCVTTASGYESQAAAPAAGEVGPGLDANGVVIDSRKVEMGHGQKVKGLDDWEGEITGVVIPGSPFTKLKIGMPLRQVIGLVGQPTDQGSYLTGKAWIPFYYGSDRYRYELAYRAQGRLVFAGGSAVDQTGAHLIWIIYSPTDSGYR